MSITNEGLTLKSGHKKFLLALLPLLVITIATTSFILPILHGITLVGLNDWDQFLAFYHPVRESFLAGQFPWWNPYIAGGTPLFANPQVGVFSLQTPLIFYFGVVAGLKYATVLYYLLGALGMYCLTRRLGSPSIRAVLLSLVWTFSSFTAFHFHVGHYTFLTYLLVPWLFYLLIKVSDKFWFFPLLGLGVALFINTAIHNIVIQTLVFLVMASPFVWWRGGRKLKTLGGYLLALAIAILLSLPKVLLSYQYTSQFSRISEPAVQLPIPWHAAWKALTATHQTVSDTSLIQNVGWWEVSAFVGILTILLAIVGAIVSLRRNGQAPEVSSSSEATEQSSWRRLLSFAAGRRLLPLIFCLLAVLAFDIALGNTLYRGLLHLPVFDLMRVPSRWLGWVIFFVVLAVGSVRHRWKYYEVAMCLALVVTISQEFAFVRPQFSTVFTSSPSTAVHSQKFEQYDHYPTVAGGYTGGYEAELAGYGEIRGYDPILGYNWEARPTARCGINNGCRFLSPNAEVVYWSPNIIKLQRLGDGPITVNMNPTSYLWVNGKQAYPVSRVAELLETVVVDDSADLITLEMKPSL